MEELFKDVLEKDEKIIKVIKPSKRRYWRSAFFFAAIPIFWPHLIIFMVLTLFTLPYLYHKSYTKQYYAYTNKRLIKRTGLFGVKFESLEYKDITATSVEVSFLDKGCNTGALKFSSPSVHAGHPMNFSDIENPYEIMREIKEQIALSENK